MARWLYKGGPEVEELLLPSSLSEPGVHALTLHEQRTTESNIR